MARVLIAAKTRMGDYYTCVGGLNLETNQSVRLLRSDGSNQPGNTRFEVGQVWELAFQPEGRITPPHVEDVRVIQETYTGPISNCEMCLCSEYIYGGVNQINYLMGSFFWKEQGIFRGREVFPFAVLGIGSQIIQ